MSASAGGSITVSERTSPGPARGGEQAADAAVGVADQVRRLGEQGRDVLRVAVEVDALGVGAGAEAAAVEEPEAELVRERRLPANVRAAGMKLPCTSSTGSPAPDHETWRSSATAREGTRCDDGSVGGR